jgi:hypothetical protein
VVTTDKCRLQEHRNIQSQTAYSVTDSGGKVNVVEGDEYWSLREKKCLYEQVFNSE